MSTANSPARQTRLWRQTFRFVDLPLMVLRSLSELALASVALGYLLLLLAADKPRCVLTLIAPLAIRLLRTINARRADRDAGEAR